MDQKNTLNRTLALAGVFQTALLVKQLATTGRASDPELGVSIQSLFKIDAANVLEIYNGADNLRRGLEEIIRLFTHAATPKDSDVARYVFSLLHLERVLSKKPKSIDVIRAGIQRATLQAQHFSALHENVLANLAGLYTDTLSTFSFRIHITGETLYLTQAYTINKIRALLLAGIRSAVLWRQLGGHRWQLLVSRRAIIKTARALLEQTLETERS